MKTQTLKYVNFTDVLKGEKNGEIYAEYSEICSTSYGDSDYTLVSINTLLEDFDNMNEKWEKTLTKARKRLMDLDPETLINLEA